MMGMFDLREPERWIASGRRGSSLRHRNLVAAPSGERELEGRNDHCPSSLGIAMFHVKHRSEPPGRNHGRSLVIGGAELEEHG
jgi:hypothetical protein